MHHYHYWLRFLLLITLGLANGAAALAQPAFPAKAISLFVPYVPGGPTDQHLRILADEASKILGQTVVVENRPGANGTNAARLIMNAKPDGYSIGLMPATIYREPHINKVNYDPLTFSPIILLTDYTFGIAVRTDAPWKTWQELVADAKTRPGMINMGVPGFLSSPNLYMQEIAQTQGISFNVVPFKGDGETITALLGSHIDIAPLSGATSQHIEAGKMRYLVMLTEQRIARYPDVPTVKESGANIWIESPYGIVGPQGMDPAKVKILHDAFKTALYSERSKEVMTLLNQQINYKGPQEYGQYMRATYEQEKQRVQALRKAGIVE